MKNIHIYIYIFYWTYQVLHWDTILCIEVFAIQCNSKRSKNSVWFIKQWFVLIWILFVSLCVFERNLSCSLHGSECTTHYALSDLLTVKPLFALADSCVEMDGNENESAVCVKGQRVCLWREWKSSFTPHSALSPIRCSWMCRSHKVDSRGGSIHPTVNAFSWLSVIFECMSSSGFRASLEQRALISQFKIIYFAIEILSYSLYKIL